MKLEKVGAWSAENNEKEPQDKPKNAPALTQIGTWKESNTLPAKEKPFYETPENEKTLTQSGDLDTAMRVSKGDLTWALKVTRGIEPDTSARVKQISEALKMPKDTIKRNLGTAEEIKRAREVIRQLTEKDTDGKPRYPYTLAWLSDPKKMALAKDDVEAMVGLERAVRANRQEDEGILSGTWRAIQYGLNSQINPAILRIPGTLMEVANYIPNKSAEILGLDFRLKVPDYMFDNALTRYYEQGAEYIKPVALEENAIDLIILQDREKSKMAIPEN